MNYTHIYLNYLDYLYTMKINITLEERDKLHFKPIIWVKINNEELQVSYALRKGAVKVLHVRGCAIESKYRGCDFPLNYKFDKMFYKKYRTITDFNIPFTIKPNSYRYCEGGGWHSMQDVYVVNNKEFVNL